MTSRLFLLQIAFLASSVVAAPSAPVKLAPVSFEIAAAPAWVLPVKADHSISGGDDGGISYLLFDRQDNVGLQSSYFHEVRRVTSENGVQNGASVSATFDPSYQKLIFHALHLIRAGTRLNRLDRAGIKLFQREKDIESFLYDGAYTAQCELEDVRVGDVIEYSFSIVGMNPVMNGRYQRVFYTDWSFPVHRVITRLVYPAERQLHFQTKNRPLKPAITTEKGTSVWMSDDASVPARRTDSDVPTDYDANGWVQFSEFMNWRGVAEWALPLFQIAAPFSAELQNEIEKIRGITDIEKRIFAALRLVQDQVRYLGIESGVGSHRPTAPSEVFRRRFGDCKDKGLLLTAVLQQCGVDAAPALVSTTYRKTVADRLPAPDDFNHAIVQVRNGDNVHWLDPTRSSQRGKLSQIYVRDLGYALVLRSGTDGLTAYSPPRDSLPRRKVSESYRVPAPGGTGDLEVVTECYGLSAERARNTFQENGRDKIEKQYLQYYARTFPKIKTRKPLGFQELPDENACRVTESYSIPDIWEWNQEEGKYQLLLYPGDIAEAMGTAGPSQRDDPLELNYPANVTQEIHASMFDRWQVNIKNHSANNSFFRFSDKATVKGKQLDFIYHFETLADRVPPADLPGYNSALSKARDSLGYSLSYQAPAESIELRRWFSQINWRLGLLGSVVLTLTMVLAALYIYKTKLPAPLPPPAFTLPGLEGLRGWLFLVGVHHVFYLINFFVVLCGTFSTMLNLEAWRVLTEPGTPQYHPLWQPTLLFEFFFNIVVLVLSGLLAVLFFRKRAAWPRTYALFLALLLAGSLVDAWLVQKIPVAGADDSGIREVVRGGVAALIWIPYCFVSKRVKATFRH